MKKGRAVGCALSSFIRSARLVEGIDASEQAVDHRLPEDGDLGRAPHILVCYGAAGGYRPVANGDYASRGSKDAGRPIQIAEDDLGDPVVYRRHVLDGGALPRYCLGIVEGECRLTAESRPDASRRLAARKDDEKVAPHARHLFGDLPACTRTDGHHCDNRAHPYDDAEHGKG